MSASHTLEYDVALSFAGEDREYVEQVAKVLRDKDCRFFYDEYERVSLWGKDLYTHLTDVYRKRARYTIMFISEHYAKKMWPSHERATAQARAIEDNQEYILPARFDSTEVPGLLPTTAYIDLRNINPIEFAELILEKLDLSKQRASTAYSNKSNSELKLETLNLVSTTRDLVQRERQAANKLLFRRHIEASVDMIEEEKNEAFWRQSEAHSANLNECMSEYEQHYKVRAILLRDELLYRLPTQQRDEQVNFMYEHPTNPLGLDTVVSDLERLAHLLPE